MKRYHAPRGNGNDLARFGVAARARRLVAYLEIAETRQLHFDALGKRLANFFEEGVDDIFGFTLVEPHPLEEQFGKFCLGKSTISSHRTHSFRRLRHAGAHRGES